MNFISADIKIKNNKKNRKCTMPWTRIFQLRTFQIVVLAKNNGNKDRKEAGLQWLQLQENLIRQ